MRLLNAIAGRKNALCLLALSAALLLAPHANAQFGSSSVLGYVHDNSGAVVPGAKVRLTNVATNVVVTVVSDKEGKFEFDSVPIGNYRVTTEASGFATEQTEVFNVATDARQRVEVALKAGANETVEVTGAAQLLETDTSSRSQVIGTREVENLPLNGRDYGDLVLLAPGTRKSILENQTASSRADSYNINGQRSEFNEFILDGLENSNYGTSNQGFENENITPSPDAVSEFRLETNNYSAEYGRMPGAVINVQTRSGTNQYHGHAWDYVRNTDLNAVGPIEPITNQKPKLIRNQFGATVGGPVLKDKVFFFADYEGLRQIFNYQLAPVTLPSAQQRLGHFFYNNDPTKPIPLYNPITGVSYTSGDISSGATPFALGVLAALPADNVTTDLTNPAAYTNNYSNAPRGTINDDKGDIRVDQHYGKWQLFSRYTEHQGYIFDPPTVGGPAGGNANSNVYIKNRQVAGGATWLLSSNKSLDIRFAWTANKGGKTPYTQGQASLLTKYGITDGLPTDPSIVRSLNGQSISGFTQLGNQTSSPQFQWPTIFNPKINYSWVRGRHSMKFGYEQQIIHTEVNDFNPSYGQDNYASKFAAGTFVACSVNPAPPCLPALSTDTQIAQAQEVADFLFGNRSSYSLTNYTIVNLRQRYFAGYFQDDFAISPKLTVNAGLRYEIMTPQWERDNKLANFNPATSSIIQASSGSIYNRALVHVPTKNFAPRLGFSYAADPKTAIRAGYGLVYVQYNREGGENNLTYNGPNVVNAAINNPNPNVTPIGSNLCTNDTQNQALCFRQTQQGYANGLTSSANFNPLLVNTRYIPANFTTGYVQSYFLGIQRTLPSNILLDVAYVGNVGRHIQVLADYNQATPCLAATLSGCASYQSRRPVPTFGDIEVSLPIGTASYNSLQVKLEKRVGALYILNSFTYGRAFDIASGHLETTDGDNSRVNIANPRGDYGPSSYDQPIDNTTSLVWDLPYGKGQRYGKDANGFLQQAFGGWQLTMINTMTSGLPLNITYSSSTTNGTTGMLYTSDLVTLRPQHLTGTPLKNGKSSWAKATKYAGLTNYLPLSSYALPSYANYGNTSAYGNVSRNIVRGFGYYDTDFGLHKQFGLGVEHVKLDFRAEVFNAFNVTNWQAPDTAITDGSSFGSITSNFPARQMQFAGKIIF
ncbi:TonB-dependent Receptor Plug Domain [Bryocella elongata]|uniref:TonB-dependent Receptor Plug Domain n=1 Tax=Bryocella elongata TaxID=863522 RepID=A0A1H6AXZ2_9BACT|nr:TonB-dependent receptor [Bryocella elongata]SEG53438.1 TonB-dependent Receptor Plug Domain [Bryocella elongata]